VSRPRSHRQRRRRWLAATALLFAVASLVVAFPFLLRGWVDWRYKPRIYTVEAVPERRVAIVFGAGITGDGRPLPALADRVWTAAELYKAGKVGKLLMSGDNRFIEYN
jgi:vancomycin permeability regulator SanA